MDGGFDRIEVRGGVEVRSWTQGVPFEEEARRQVINVARMGFVAPWIAVMPDVHWGLGATIGSVIPTEGAVIPAAVGVDIGCGMMAVRTSLRAEQLPDNLHALRIAIERSVPHGRTVGRGRSRDEGSWQNPPPDAIAAWSRLARRFEKLVAKHRALEKTNNRVHMGTLGTGNHFIEVCLDEYGHVWAMLHSGSRGVGNKIGTHFIALAKRDMERQRIHLPDSDLAYLEEGSDHFAEYVEAVEWAQDFARLNREVMMARVLAAMEATMPIEFHADLEVVNCHHNYVARESHFGRELLITRKGAVRARAGDLGIIPGSMGARSYIVRGLGNPDSFCSCSHGAGRLMSRNQAKKSITLAQHAKATEGVECRKDEGVLDESPAAYKSIDAVMEAQKDLVEIVHTLRQIVCVKG